MVEARRIDEAALGGPHTGAVRLLPAPVVADRPVADPPELLPEGPEPESGGGGARVRIVEAALACLARQGLARTTMDDVAREARLSRASLYRTFPGGKAAVMAAVVDTEVERLFWSLAVAMGEAEGLEEALVAGMVHAAGQLAHHTVVCRLLAEEPGEVLPYLAFGAMDHMLDTAGSFAGPFLARWLEPEQARRAAEWAARIVISYVFSPAQGFDLCEPADTRRLVQRFVVPGIEAVRRAEREGRKGPPGGAGKPGAGRRVSPEAAPGPRPGHGAGPVAAWPMRTGPVRSGGWTKGRTKEARE